MPDYILEQIVTSLQTSHEGKAVFRETQYKQLTEEHEVYTKRLEKIYIDRLDGRITDNEYDKYYQSVCQAPNSLLADLVINNPNIGIRKTIQLFGLKQVFDSSTPRELRGMFGKYGQRSWYRLIAEAKTIKLPTTRSPLGTVREHLTSFEPLKLVDFEGDMLNNDKYGN